MKEAARNRTKEATILIIVYEHVVRNILTTILTTNGHEVISCSVGFNGIRTFKKGKGKFDLVMIDIGLPDISSLSVVKKIKKISQKTPVILIKGWGKALDANKLKDSGADFIISKPFYMDKTLELVENAI